MADKIEKVSIIISKGSLDGVYEHDDRHLETIRSQSQLLSRIVDDLRTVSLAEAGKLPLDLVRLWLAQTVSNLKEVFALLGVFEDEG